MTSHQVQQINVCLSTRNQNIFVYDVIRVAPDQMRIDKVLESLKDKLEMTVEGDVTSFLGIEFTCHNTGGIQMSLLGLIDRVLKMTGLQDCNPDCTPASQTPLGTDKNGKDFEEEWQNVVVFGFKFLARNCLCHTSMCKFHTTQKHHTEMP